MHPARITDVRVDRASAARLLQDFLFGGRFGIGRVPRGLDPEMVADFIVFGLAPDAPPNAFGKALDAMRFYEAARALPRLELALTRNEADETDLRRSAFVLQAVAEFAPGRCAEAVAYLDRHLVPLPAALAAWPVLLDVLVLAGPVGSFTALEGRLAEAIRTAQALAQAGEAQLLAWHRLQALQRNDLPRARWLAQGRAALRLPPPATALRAWVRAYLGLGDVSGPLIESLVARELRAAAMQGRQGEVLAAFDAELQGVLASGAPQDDIDFVLVRGGQAMVYLGGELPPACEAPCRAGTMASAHFLWDDPA